SGVTEPLPLTIFDTVLRDTPSASATSVTDNASGSSHRPDNTSPGCGGLCCRNGCGLVIVFIVHHFGIVILKPECDPPVGLYRHCPNAFPFAFERMQRQARRIDIADSNRLI